MALSLASAVPPPPGARTKWLSTKPTLIGGSSGLEGISSGRPPDRRASSATRAVRLPERTDANVAAASTSVPPAVASAEIVTQLAIAASYQHTRPGHLPHVTLTRPTLDAFGMALRGARSPRQPRRSWGPAHPARSSLLPSAWW